jgi:hypothetical protein
MLPADALGTLPQPSTPTVEEVQAMMKEMGTDDPHEAIVALTAPKRQKPKGKPQSVENVIVPGSSVPGQKALAWAEASKLAMSEINKVHKFPGGVRQSKIHIKHPEEAEGFSPGTDGVYDPFTETLTLNADMLAADPTIIHEIGHKLDYDYGDTSGATFESFGSKTDPDFQPVMKAIRDSKAYHKMFGSAAILLTDIDYWTSPSELFARAYAQWIETRNGKPNWKGGERRGVVDVDNGAQWKPDDFKPIAEAFDKLMEKKGLLS